MSRSSHGIPVSMPFFPIRDFQNQILLCNDFNLFFTYEVLKYLKSELIYSVSTFIILILIFFFQKISLENIVYRSTTFITHLKIFWRAFLDFKLVKFDKHHISFFTILHHTSPILHHKDIFLIKYSLSVESNKFQFLSPSGA